MNHLDYWEECISDAAEGCGATLTIEQIKYIAEAVDGWHDNFSMAFGYDVADRNFVSDDTRKLQRIEKELEDKRIWELSTKPCRSCNTTGTVLDG